jgi:superfamily I DNA and/or RNA helicase
MSDITDAINIFKNNENQKKIDTAFVVGITCAATSFDSINNINCPIVVIDESSQLTEPMAMLPISRFKSKIAMLVGDPLQLMPTLSSDFAKGPENASGLELTMFERLALNGCLKPILLRTQYRCHPDISHFSNALFYEGLLNNGEKTARLALIDGIKPLTIVKVDGHELRTNSSYQNPQEASVAVACIKHFLVDGVPPEDIVIICLCKAFTNHR